MQERRRLREMMGRKSAARKLFYDFSLEERVPRDHFLRRLTQVVDFSFVYDMVKPYYSHTGTPSVDPVVVFKMALIGYLYNIPSERRLAEEVRLNLSSYGFWGTTLTKRLLTTVSCPNAGSALGKKSTKPSLGRCWTFAEMQGWWKETECILTPLYLRPMPPLSRW